MYPRPPISTRTYTLFPYTTLIRSMYGESVGVPLIIRGPDVEQGRVETAAVSHIDIYNTVLNSVGIPAEQGTASARSQSLLGKLSPDRVVMSEYHPIGSSSAVLYRKGVV